MSARKSGEIRQHSASRSLSRCQYCSQWCPPCHARTTAKSWIAFHRHQKSHESLDHAGRLLSLNSQRHMRPVAEMVRLFGDMPAATQNSVELSSRLQFELSDLGYEFPHYSVPDGDTMDSFLRKRVAEGIVRRYGAKNNHDLLKRARETG